MKKQVGNKLCDKAGFTLVELVVVIANHGHFIRRRHGGLQRVR